MHTTPSSQPRGLFNVQQAAEYLGVAISTVRAWVYKGLLAHIKLGNSQYSALRFRHVDLEAFIEAHWFPIKE